MPSKMSSVDVTSPNAADSASSADTGAGPNRGPRLGGEPGPEKDELLRLREPDEPHETLRPACAGDQAQGNFRLSDLGASGRDPEVTRECELAAAPERVSIDRGDRGLREIREAREHLARSLRERPDFVGLANVSAGGDVRPPPLFPRSDAGRSPCRSWHRVRPAQPCRGEASSA